MPDLPFTETTMRRLISANPGECWRIITRSKNGYVRIGRGGETLAHRLVWIDAHGPIPAGHEIHHECRTPNCVNLEHLRLLTAAEHRAIHNPPADLTTPPPGLCRHGHDWAAHGQVTTQGCWVCRVCMRDAGRRHDAKRRPITRAAKPSTPRTSVTSPLLDFRQPARNMTRPTVPPGGSCKHGHPWEVNAKLSTQGRWICVECSRGAESRYRARLAGRHA